MRAIGISEHEASEAAAALSERDDHGPSVKSELNVITWMMGFVLAFQAAIFAKPFMR